MSAAQLPRRESLGYQVNHLARLLAQALAAQIAPFGVVPGQFAQLLALFEQDGMTQRELCDRVRIEQPTMANTLQRMQRWPRREILGATREVRASRDAQ